jgi:hypothetical protein
MIAFAIDYWTAYPERARPWFDARLHRLAAESRDAGEWRRFVEWTRGYPPIARRYYDMVYADRPCRRE